MTVQYFLPLLQLHAEIEHVHRLLCLELCNCGATSQPLVLAAHGSGCKYLTALLNRPC